MNPLENAQAYDSFLLAGVRSPGMLLYTAPKREEGWDAVQAKGSAGAEVVNNGTKPCKFQWSLMLWRPFHYREWDAFKSLFRTSAKEGSQQQALDIYHPLLAEIGVTSVVVVSWTPPTPDRKGAALVQLELLEYAPSKAKDVGKPRGSKGGGFSGVNLLAGIGATGPTGGAGGGIGAAFGDAPGTKRSQVEQMPRAVNPEIARRQERIKAQREELAAP